MSAPDLAILVFGGPQAVADVVRALPPGQASEGVVVHGMPESLHGWMARGEPIVCVGVGADGGAELATWLGAGGLDGVAGVGLVGVTAPWAERFLLGLPDEIYNDGPDYEGEVWPPIPEYSRLPLGPLEPLRAAAERARVGEMTFTDGSGSWPDGTPHEGGKAYRRADPLRLVVACAPDNGVCVACGGKAAHQYREGSAYNMLCAPCQGTGKALTSAAVAGELVGVDVGAVTDSIASGGAWIDVYSSSVALTEHGLRAVVERLTR